MENLQCHEVDAPTGNTLKGFIISMHSLCSRSGEVPTIAWRLCTSLRMNALSIIMAC